MKIALFLLIGFIPGRTPEPKNFLCEMSPGYEETLYNEPDIIRVNNYICGPADIVCKCSNSLGEPTQCSWKYSCLKDTIYIRRILDE